MSGRILFIVSFIFALLQGTIFPLVFVEGFLVVLYLATRTVRLGLPLVASGLIFDLFQNQHLGVTSLIFLGALGIVILAKENVILQRAVVLSLFAVGVNALRSKLLFGYIELFPLVVIFGISYLVFSAIWRPDVSGKIRI